MGKKIEKVKAFCKEHKKEIAVAVVTGVGVAVGVTACVVMKKKLDTTKLLTKSLGKTNQKTSIHSDTDGLNKIIKALTNGEDMPNGEVAECLMSGSISIPNDVGIMFEEYPDSKGVRSFVANKIKLSDIAKLGEEIMKLMDIGKDKEVWAMIEVADK